MMRALVQEEVEIFLVITKLCFWPGRSKTSTIWKPESIIQKGQLDGSKSVAAIPISFLHNNDSSHRFVSYQKREIQNILNIPSV